LLTASGGSSYQWYKNNVVINGATAATYLATQAGSYTVTISNGSCSSPSSNAAVVTELGNAPVGIISPASAAICLGTSQLLTATGGASYQWYRNGVTINGASSSTYSATSDGIYSVDVINSNGCRARATNDATVSTNAAPNGVLSPSSGTICNNGSLTLTASGGTSYQWYKDGVPVTGATSSSLIVTAVGTYTVDIISSNGCKAKASNTAVITSGTAPTGTISPSTAVICASQGTTLTATGGTNYQWFRNGTLISGATASTYQAISAGVYSVIVFSGSCNGAASNTATVTENSSLTFSVNLIQPTCAAPTGTIMVVSPFGGSGSGYMYSIDGGANFQSSNTFNNVPVGNYQVVMKDGAECRSNLTPATLTAFSSTLQGSVVTTNITCSQTTASATITASGGTAPYIYSLNNAPFQTANAFPNLTAGTYSAVVKDALGCTKELPLSIQAVNSTLSALPTITNPTCHQQTGSAEITASGGAAGYSYSLDNGPYQSTNSFSNLSLGLHKATVKDQGGCLFEVSFEIKQTSTNPKLIVVNPATICPDDKANLQLPAITQGSDAALQLSYWKDSMATVPLSTPNAVSAGTYYILATNSTGCQTIQPVTISAYNIGVGKITFSGPSNPCVGQTITLSASSGQMFQWYRNNVAINGATNKSLTVSNDGSYSVAIQEGNCVVPVSDTINLRFTNCPTIRKPDVFVPKAFTPNNNGANDVLRPITYNINELRYFKIYNRWGQLVFETNIIGKGWDGKINGLSQPAEPYTWILECLDANGNAIKKSGRSLLIR